MENQTDQYNKYKLRIAALDKTGSWSGGKVTYFIFMEIIKLMNIDYELVIPQDNGGYGVCNETYCSGMIGLVQRNEADVICGTIIPTADRTPHLSLTFTGVFFNIYLVHASDMGAEFKVTATFSQPFNTNVLSLIGLMTVLLWVLRIVQTRINNQPRHMMESFWSTFQALFIQKNTKNVLYLFIFTSLYTWYYAGCRGQVLSPKLDKRLFSSVDELTELLKSRQVTMATELTNVFRLLFGSNHEFIELIETEGYIPEKIIMEDAWYKICHTHNLIVLLPALVPHYPPCNVKLWNALSPFPVFYAFSKVKSVSHTQIRFRQQLKRFSEHFDTMKSIAPKFHKNLQSFKDSIEIPIENQMEPVLLNSLGKVFNSMLFIYCIAFVVFIAEIFSYFWKFLAMPYIH